MLEVNWAFSEKVFVFFCHIDIPSCHQRLGFKTFLTEPKFYSKCVILDGLEWPSLKLSYQNSPRVIIVQIGNNAYFYEAKLNSLLCKRTPQQAKIRFFGEFATLLLFFDLLCCFGFHKQIPKTLYRSKSLQK